VRYVPKPIDPPVLEQSYRTRTLADPNLEEFFKANSGVQPQTWPPQSMDIDALTVLALYFSPDLDEARSRVAAAEAAITSSRARPNPNANAAGGYTDAPEGPFAFQFNFEIPFETAGKRQYRIQRAQQLTEAERFSLGETAWRIRSRLRAALADHLISSRELEQRNAEAQIRQEI